MPYKWLLTILYGHVCYFIGQPEEAATHRVGLVILAPAAQLVVALLPSSRPDNGE